MNLIDEMKQHEAAIKKIQKITKKFAEKVHKEILISNMSAKAALIAKGGSIGMLLSDYAHFDMWARNVSFDDSLERVLDLMKHTVSNANQATEATSDINQTTH